MSYPSPGEIKFFQLFNNKYSTKIFIYVFSVSPIELLVALHCIDAASAELKFVVKATSLCLAEKEIYTQDVSVLIIVFSINSNSALLHFECSNSNCKLDDMMFTNPNLM